MKRKIIHVPSFPSCTWERRLMLAKFYFALIQPAFIRVEIGNEIASASAFPNGIWERGKRKGYTVMALAFALLALTPLLRAQPEPDNQPLTPYQTALLDYKTGKYDDARTAIDAAETANPGDLPTEVLKARILTQQLDFAGAKKVLDDLNGKPGMTPEIAEARTLAFGDLFLRKGSFDQAAKFYGSLLAQKPGDPDLILKVVYTRVGAADLVEAAKYASLLKPLDPDHPCYYFAKAALAQATGKTQEADDDIQTARTVYGITVTNRYLKTYLQVFASSEKTPASDMTPPPLTPTPAK